MSTGARVGEPVFLVTGSGRSGTGYLATVLRKCGLEVGHENWWGMGPRTPGLDGDVSWLGCFDYGYTGPVFAQVRDPRTAIPSLAATVDHHPWWIVRAQNVRLTGHRDIDACLIWEAYTEAAVARAGASRWWQVEHLDAGTLRKHFDVRISKAIHALATTPNTINTRDKVPDFDWPDHPVVARVRALAWILGYDNEGVGA